MAELDIEPIDFLPEPIGGKQPAPAGASIAALLRSGRRLSPAAWTWLADLFDPESQLPWQVKEIGNRGRKGGRPAGPVIPHMDAVERLWEMLEGTETEPKKNRQRAEHDTGKEFGITRSTLQRAEKGYKKARAEHDAILAEESQG